MLQNRIFLSLCHHSYGHNFYLILMKFCNKVRQPKTKKAFVRRQNPITPSPLLLQFFTRLMHFQREGANNTETSSLDRLWQLMTHIMRLGAAICPKLKNATTLYFALKYKKLSYRLETGHQQCMKIK